MVFCSGERLPRPQAPKVRIIIAQKPLTTAQKAIILHTFGVQVVCKIFSLKGHFSSRVEGLGFMFLSFRSTGLGHFKVQEVCLVS